MPYLTVDSGGLLFKKETLTPGRQEVEKITAEGIIDAYNLMSYDAVAIGRQDLAAGIDYLLKIQDKSSFKWLSANLLNKSSNSLFFPASIIKKVGDIDVGIIGLTGTPKHNPFLTKENIALLQWQKILPKLVKKLQKKCDLLVLLSSLSPQENKIIAAQFENIHIIIQSQSRASNLQPHQVQNTLITQTGNQGKYLAAMKLNWETSAAWQPSSSPALINKKKQLENLLRQRQRYNNSTIYEERRKRLTEEIKQLELIDQKNRDTAMLYSTYQNWFIPLDTSLPDDAAVSKIVRDIHRKIQNYGKQSIENYQIKKTATKQLDQYTGWQECNICHQAQSKKWQISPHARSYQTLVKKKQHYNSKCVPCHVTGINTVDDTALLVLPTALRNVGCENCHGPGKLHSQDPKKNKLIRLPSAKTCTRCHTPEQDDKFDYDSDILRLNCNAS